MRLRGHYCGSRGAAGSKRFSFRDRAIDPFAAPRRLTVARRSRATPASISRRWLPRSPRPVWRRRRPPPAFARPPPTLGRRFQRVLVEKTNRTSARAGDDPLRISAIQSPLSRPKAADPRLAERFELYACGVELATASASSSMCRATQTARTPDGGEGAHLRRALSHRRGFSHALAAMPEACGIASTSIGWSCLRPEPPRVDEVVWTPMSALETIEE